jgi:hypothetical protein
MATQYFYLVPCPNSNRFCQGRSFTRQKFASVVLNLQKLPIRRLHTFFLRWYHSLHFNCFNLSVVFQKLTMVYPKSSDSSVGIALGYGLDDRGSRVRFPAGAGNFSVHQRVQNGSRAHPASYPMGTRGCFPGGKAAEA